MSNNSCLPDFEGRLYIHQQADPAAGANMAFNLPADYIYRINSVEFVLTTDANVANRCVRLMPFCQTIELSRITSLSNQIASASVIYTFALNIGHASVTNLIGMNSFPDLGLLESDVHLETAILNLQVGDQISAICVTTHRWPILQWV